LKIDSANSGAATIKKIMFGNMYDIIFMDHMMPEMDGIEATKIIRNIGYEKPIVALTANAVAGQSAMFLENGFNDFISKPVDVRQLNAVLNKFIRDIQPPNVIEAAKKQTKANNGQPPINAPQSAINMSLAEVFTWDALKILESLETLIAKNDYSNENNMKTYIINVHGIKNALANIGKTDLSAVALKLEKAGRGNEIEIIKSETHAFISSLRAVVEEIKPVKETATSGKTNENNQYLTEMLLKIKAACEEYDENTADKALSELRKTAWPPQTDELLGTIAEQLLHSDFDEIIAAIKKFIA
jgi:CheY-like chemotaxis protein/HPt (histidine-containing phosphotransfer) domain-containing protein